MTDAEFDDVEHRGVKLGSDTAAGAAMRIVDLIRAVEWKGSGGRCPWCEEWPAIPDKDVPDGHAEDCPAREYFDAR